MAVTSLKPGYGGEVRDREENFHGMRLFYVAWDQHLIFTNPVALLLPPDTTFAAFVRDVLPGLYSEHPDWDRIDWERVKWLRDGAPFMPDGEADLGANGIGFKSVLRLQTPGLSGLKGSCS